MRISKTPTSISDYIGSRIYKLGDMDTIYVQTNEQSVPECRASAVGGGVHAARGQTPM